MARIAVADRQFDQAIRLLRGLVEAAPGNEADIGHLMLVQALAGRRGGAIHTYQTLRVYLVKELKMQPELRLQRLYQAIRDGATLTGHWQEWLLREA
jgi:DNA-binding SARP family transcriptional activator